VPNASRPVIGAAWEIGVLDGPHGAPDFITEAGIAAFYAASWTVHYNSSCTGVRLIGPRPDWARADGGEAGLHPSNIHDTAYAIGAVDFTGDMPVILGPDGPSLGGFVCPVVIAASELWKAGQLRAGDTVRFKRTPPAVRGRDISAGGTSVLLGGRPATADAPRVAYRRAGDRNVLIEYGEPLLDLELRFRVHALMQALAAMRLPGVIDLTPGIRSLQVHYDPGPLPLARLLDALARIEADLPPNDDIALPSRTVHLCRCPGTTRPRAWPSSATCAGCARMRPGAPATSSSSGASTAWTASMT